MHRAFRDTRPWEERDCFPVRTFRNAALHLHGAPPRRRDRWLAQGRTGRTGPGPGPRPEEPHRRASSSKPRNRNDPPGLPRCPAPKPNSQSLPSRFRQRSNLRPDRSLPSPSSVARRTDLPEVIRVRALWRPGPRRTERAEPEGALPSRKAVPGSTVAIELS